MSEEVSREGLIEENSKMMGALEEYDVELKEAYKRIDALLDALVRANQLSS